MIISQFDKLCNWIKHVNDTDVLMGEGTSFMGHYVNRIIIHHNYNLEKNGLIALLHECGHALQPKTPTGVNKYKLYEVRSDKFKKGLYENEVDAWKRARDIAVDLHLNLDWVAFNREESASIKTYQY